jgi:hypothetical protein
MNAQLLIDSVVRQFTVLIAQLATSGGVRAPVAHIVNQVFVELANELHAQGVSRKVSADMFGMALRAYIRKLRRLSEGQTDTGRTLWQAVLEFVRNDDMVSRERVLSRFRNDGENLVTAILHDLTESGLLFCSGSGPTAVYRAASDAELGKLSALAADAGLDALLLAFVYRGGPATTEELAAKLGRPVPNLQQVLDRLVQSGGLQQLESGRYQATNLIIPLGSPVGWEAAVFDHFQAMVQTICQRLDRTSPAANATDVVGGSTFTFDIWPGHPMEAEVRSQLTQLRQRCHELRERVDAHNAQGELPERHEQVVTYVGQCVLERDLNPGPDLHEEEGDLSDESA